MVAPNEQYATARFPLGECCITPGAIETLAVAGTEADILFRRHQCGDWGDVCGEDRQANENAIGKHERILSAYTLPTGAKIWVITEADRSVTTVLLPEEY